MDEIKEKLNTSEFKIKEDLAIHLYGVVPPKASEWKCYLFGSHNNIGTIVWIPNEGKEPNWFWRKMQFIILGNNWVKEKCPKKEP